MPVKTLDELIVVIPGVKSGRPHIAGRRISVQNIVIWHEWQGHSADEIANDYDLNLSDVYAALTYYYVHREEIDKDIKDDEEFIESMRKELVSK